MFAFAKYRYLLTNFIWNDLVAPTRRKTHTKDICQRYCNSMFNS